MLKLRASRTGGAKRGGNFRPIYLLPPAVVDTVRLGSMAFARCCSRAPEALRACQPRSRCRPTVGSAGMLDQGPIWLPAVGCRPESGAV